VKKRNPPEEKKGEDPQVKCVRGTRKDESFTSRGGARMTRKDSEKREANLEKELGGEFCLLDTIRGGLPSTCPIVKLVGEKKGKKKKSEVHPMASMMVYVLKKKRP